MYKLAFLLVAAGLVGGTLTGCGDDEPEGTTDGGTVVDSSTNDTGTNDSGTNDSGTSDGGTIDSGSDAGISTEPVACGSTQCEYVPVTISALPGADFPIPACCVDAQTEECGADIASTYETYMTRSPEGCIPFEQPGSIDESCPTGSYELPNFMRSFELQGCCMPNNTCGIWADLTSLTVPADADAGTPELIVGIANFGCVAREDYLAEPGDPVNCEYVAPTE